MHDHDPFRISPDHKVDLTRFDPAFKEHHLDKESAAAETERHTQRLAELQYLLYAEQRRSLLICLQALDAGGKDGTIRHVMGPLNPQGTRVHAFKVPSAEEAAHDFLWRAHRQAPERGEVVIFNRSHYEDVLVARVHELVPKAVWQQRYDLINDFEHNLTVNGTVILKFFLHISPQEQLRRFKQRLDDPARHWKISAADYEERKHWDAYRKAYEDVLSRTSTTHAPWYVIPSDHKWFRNLAVSRIIANALDVLKMRFPEPSVDIDEVRRQYHDAATGES